MACHETELVAQPLGCRVETHLDPCLSVGRRLDKSNRRGCLPRLESHELTLAILLYCQRLAGEFVESVEAAGTSAWATSACDTLIS